MAVKLVVGTIRARRGERHVVVFKGGVTTTLELVTDTEPGIGADVIGMLDLDDPTPRMTVVPNVTHALLRGNARIVPMGRPDVTATMLARLVKGTGLGAIRAGTGGVIERTPRVADPDLAWALDFLRADAAELGLGLNVIDPLALAKGEWSDDRLRDEALPADAVDGRDGVADLRRLMDDAFSPACRTTMFELTKNTSVPSVDFVLPYSPFQTGMSWSARLAGASHGEVPLASLKGSDARRLSAFREMAKAFEPRYLGRLRMPVHVQSHVRAAFADAAAAIAFLDSGGDPEAVRTLANLRESGLARSADLRDATRAPATHDVLEVVLAQSSWTVTSDAAQVFTKAAEITRRFGPMTEAVLKATAASASDEGVLVDLEQVGPRLVHAVRTSYEDDLRDTVARLGGDPMALDRLSRFGVLTVPGGLEEVFDRVLEDAGVTAGVAGDVPVFLGDDPWLDARVPGTG